MKLFSQQIKEKAIELGFDSCGICKAAFVEEHATYFSHWLKEGKNAKMYYMENHTDKRTNSSLMMENCQSVITVALNYYPAVKKEPIFPQISYYAYGKDYHDIVKNRLRNLLEFIRSKYPDVQGRFFCDSAPILEKYHAQKSGIGWIGKNTQLILPGKGSFFFLGCLLINIELMYDEPLKNQCGDCRKCLEACPTKALEKPFTLNAAKCIAYHTIESKETIPPAIASSTNFVYGCDICNIACPHNKLAIPTKAEEFQPSEEFLLLDENKWKDLSEEDFNRIFHNSPVKRMGYENLMRNVSSIHDAANRHDQ